MALIPPHFLDCVIAIGVKRPGKLNSDLKWIATGFLVSRCTKKLDDKNTRFQVFLVTNKHVFTGMDVKDQKQIVIRFNPESGGQIKSYPIDLYIKDRPIWTGHPNGEDIAVIHLPIAEIQNDGCRFSHFHLKDDFHDESVFVSLISIKEMVEKGIAEGDFVYVLGYPMGFVDPERQYVIVRSGTIARIRDLLEGRKSDFLVDAFVFPGNSGGPVILKPELVSIQGTQSISNTYVIGIVTSYVPYEDIAYSVQTEKPRVVFQENSGLTVVLPAEFVVQTIDEHVSRMEFDAGGEAIRIRY